MRKYRHPILTNVETGFHTFVDKYSMKPNETMSESLLFETKPFRSSFIQYFPPRILSAFRDVCSAALRVADDKAVNKTVTTSQQKISTVRRIVMMSLNLCWVSRIELETKVIIRRFPKISQSQRRPLLGPSPGRKRILHRHYVNPNCPSLMTFLSTYCGLMPV